MNNATAQNKAFINSPFAPAQKPGAGARGLGGISLLQSGKRFNRDWIFRNFTYTFQVGTSYAITGPNGSGKSTLLQAIAGSLHLSEGKLDYHSIEQNTRPVEPEKFYRYISIVAPNLELVEEMTAKEFLHFHQQFKPLLPSVTVENILMEVGLENAMDKQVRYFSSGMKQRLKLAQAVFVDTPVLLLDEPCTNLDKRGYELYHSLIDRYCRHKLIIVSSNDTQEMDFCTEKLNILDYKQPDR
jgi:ABC-type multidrug transport system ATPase subunit